jgi:hypothetical protein
MHMRYRAQFSNLSEQKITFQNEVLCIRFVTFSVLRLLCLFSLIYDLKGLCLRGVCAL